MMKKTITLMMLALLGMSQMAAQDYEYVPFVREGVKWIYSIQDYNYHADYYTNPARGDNRIYRTIEIKGDTVIGGKTYKAVHKYSGDAIDMENDTIPVYLREEDKKVYAIVPDARHYDDCMLGNYYYQCQQEYADSVLSGNEFILYDFKDPISYWSRWNSDEDEWFNVNLQMDTVAVGDHLAKRYLNTNSAWDGFQIIEGIGAFGGNSYPLAFFIPLFPGEHVTERYNLEYVVDDNVVIYPQDMLRTGTCRSYARG